MATAWNPSPVQVCHSNGINPGVAKYNLRSVVAAKQGRTVSGSQLTVTTLEASKLAYATKPLQYEFHFTALRRHSMLSVVYVFYKSYFSIRKITIHMVCCNAQYFLGRGTVAPPLDLVEPEPKPVPASNSPLTGREYNISMALVLLAQRAYTRANQTIKHGKGVVDWNVAFKTWEPWIVLYTQGWLHIKDLY